MPELPAWTVAAAEAGMRLDKYLADRSRLGSRSRVSDALAKGKIFVNGSEAKRGDAGSRLRVGDVVGVWIDRPGSAHRRRRTIADSQLEVVYEDDQVIVDNKLPDCPRSISAATGAGQGAMMSERSAAPGRKNLLGSPG